VKQVARAARLRATRVVGSSSSWLDIIAANNASFVVH
jgi:hypothetical protein